MPSAVLVAEPEPETREYLGRHLRDDGFDVLGAARRSEALELAERIRPDVVLLAELDLCLRLRQGEPGRTWDRNVPVILLAPSSDPVERVRALDRGADDVMGARSPTKSCSRAFAHSCEGARRRPRRCWSQESSSSTEEPGASLFGTRWSPSRRRSSSSSPGSPRSPIECLPRKSCCARCGASER